MPKKEPSETNKSCKTLKAKDEKEIQSTRLPSIQETKDQPDETLDQSKEYIPSIKRNTRFDGKFGDEKQTSRLCQRMELVSPWFTGHSPTVFDVVNRKTKK